MLKPAVALLGSIGVGYLAFKFTLLVAVPWIAFLMWWMNREVYNEHLKPSKLSLKPVLDSVFGEQEKAEKTEEKEQDDENSKDS